MHNGQGSGGTETGADTLVSGLTNGFVPARNPGAQFYIPTEDEWYKAAYYSPVKVGAGSPGYYGDCLPAGVVRLPVEALRIARAGDARWDAAILRP